MNCSARAAPVLDLYAGIWDGHWPPDTEASTGMTSITQSRERPHPATRGHTWVLAGTRDQGGKYRLECMTALGGVSAAVHLE